MYLYVFLGEIWGGGGVMNLVYGSSSSSYMDCKVFFGDECFSFRRSGVRLDQCSCIGAFVVGLIIFGNYVYGSTTFRMSTRRLPVILFVSRSSIHLFQEYGKPVYSYSTNPDRRFSSSTSQHFKMSPPFASSLFCLYFIIFTLNYPF